MRQRLLSRISLRTAMHLTVAIVVVVWTVPTFGLFISSLRDKDQLATSGWWTALGTSEQNQMIRTDPPDAQVQRNGQYVLTGNVLRGETGSVNAFGWSSREPTAYAPGEVANLGDGKTLTVNRDGDYVLASPEPFSGRRGTRVFFEAALPPRFTLENYAEVLTSEGIGRSFINSLTVTVPATIIPILVAAFAAYALAWMRFPGRMVLFALVVGLLVVPLQMSLIPLLRLYNEVADFLGTNAKTYLGIWLAHTGFGMPLAIFLLRNYIAGLPGALFEAARVDGASHFEIFIRLVLPLSFPALASFAIFQFLWVWNDLLVAMVFLGNNEEQLVLTGRLRELLGSRGGNWEILTSAAFISMVVPLTVFFALQRFLVRGLLAGSIK